MYDGVDDYGKTHTACSFKATGILIRNQTPEKSPNKKYTEVAT